jgi:hypothetical protein
MCDPQKLVMGSRRELVSASPEELGGSQRPMSNKKRSVQGARNLASARQCL